MERNNLYTSTSVNVSLDCHINLVNIAGYTQILIYINIFLMHNQNVREHENSGGAHPQSWHKSKQILH